MLPLRIVEFWYPNALIVFLRSFKNVLSVIEEDFGVFLMMRLLFVPLFHDSSVVGRALSLCFRLSRIFFGLLAYLVVLIISLLICLIWFLSPIAILIVVSALFANFNLGVLLNLWPVLFFGIALFIQRRITEPEKKIWQVKSIKDFWKSTKVNRGDLNKSEFLQNHEVGQLLISLELTQTEIGQILPEKFELSENYLEKVIELGNNSKARFLTEAYFFVGLLKIIPGIDQKLLKLNLRTADFEKALYLLEYKRNHWRKAFIWDEDFHTKHLKGINRGWIGTPTHVLDSVSTDLTKEALKKVLPDFIGRESVILDVVNVLSQNQSRNCLIIGPAGSGKTTLVNYLAKLITLGDAPETLATKRLVQLDIPKLISNVQHEGELAEKIKLVFEEVEFSQNIIIYIDEIENLGIGESEESFNVYSLLQSYLESDKFQFLASTQAEFYGKIIEKNESFSRIFHKVELKPASFDETLEIILERTVELARFSKINVTYLAVKEIVLLSEKLINDKCLPDSAVFVLNECESRAKDNLITVETVKEVFSHLINVPVLELDNKQKQELLNLEELIHQRYINQSQAVKKIADTLRRGATGLKEDKKPIGSFLFVGPTGVGKSELAKVLAEIYFEKDAFTRFDMSEFQTDAAFDRLIGTENSPGELTEAIKRNPFCLLFLDEFEKASAKTLTLFLQILEDGRLSDSRGKVIDFKSTIIVATSNIGSLLITQEISKGVVLETIEAQVKEELLKTLKPELVNRFDNIVIFKPLEQKDLEAIVLLELRKLSNKLKSEGFLVEFDPQLISEIVRKGNDPGLGARPLKRLIQDTVEANLSKMILENRLNKGDSFKGGVELIS